MKNWALFSHGSKGWEVKDQGADKFGVWWEQLGFQDSNLKAAPSAGSYAVSSHGWDLINQTPPKRGFTSQCCCVGY